jgi:hypothetical protein
MDFWAYRSIMALCDAMQDVAPSKTSPGLRLGCAAVGRDQLVLSGSGSGAGSTAFA